MLLPLRPSSFVRPASVLAVLGMIGVSAPPPALAWGADDVSSLTLIERSVIQDQGGWQVDYRLRHDGPTGMVVTPDRGPGQGRGLGVELAGRQPRGAAAGRRWSIAGPDGPGRPSPT